MAAEMCRLYDVILWRVFFFSSGDVLGTLRANFFEEGEHTIENESFIEQKSGKHTNEISPLTTKRAPTTKANRN